MITQQTTGENLNFKTYGNHMTTALKRQIWDLRQDLSSKEQELGNLKKTLKNTKLQEFEIEMKLYVDECTRLKHMLEEVIRSKDPFSDPSQVARIEEQFQL